VPFACIVKESYHRERDCVNRPQWVVLSAPFSKKRSQYLLINTPPMAGNILPESKNVPPGTKNVPLESKNIPPGLKNIPPGAKNIPPGSGGIIPLYQGVYYGGNP
jgi:hypothetical protein